MPTDYEDAARRIAQTPGHVVRTPLTLHPTPGAIADVQRLSRIGSGGRLTIPRTAAHRVLCGELTLTEAVANAMGAGTGATHDGRRAAAPSAHEPL